MFAPGKQIDSGSPGTAPFEPCRLRMTNSRPRSLREGSMPIGIEETLFADGHEPARTRARKTAGGPDARQR